MSDSMKIVIQYLEAIQNKNIIIVKYNAHLKVMFWIEWKVLYNTVCMHIIMDHTLLTDINDRPFTLKDLYRICYLFVVLCRLFWESGSYSYSCSCDDIAERKLYNYWLMMRLTSRFINTGDLIFTKVNHDVNRYQKSITVLSIASKIFIRLCCTLKNFTYWEKNET